MNGDQMKTVSSVMVSRWVSWIAIGALVCGGVRIASASPTTPKSDREDDPIDRRGRAETLYQQAHRQSETDLAAARSVSDCRWAC